MAKEEKEKKNSSNPTMVVGEESGHSRGRGSPWHLYKMALIFYLLLLSTWVKIYVNIIARGGFTMKPKQLFFLKFLLLQFMRPFKALQLNQVILHL